MFKKRHRIKKRIGRAEEGRVGTEEALTLPQCWHEGMHTHWQQGMLGMQSAAVVTEPTALSGREAGREANQVINRDGRDREVLKEK